MRWPRKAYDYAKSEVRSRRKKDRTYTKSGGRASKTKTATARRGLTHQTKPRLKSSMSMDYLGGC